MSSSYYLPTLKKDYFKEIFLLQNKTDIENDTKQTYDLIVIKGTSFIQPSIFRESASHPGSFTSSDLNHLPRGKSHHWPFAV